MISEETKLYTAVDEFAAIMKKRLASKLKQGWHGWDEKNNVDFGQRMLLNASHARETLNKKSLIDVANLAMMLWKTNHE